MVTDWVEPVAKVPPTGAIFKTGATFTAAFDQTVYSVPEATKVQPVPVGVQELPPNFTAIVGSASVDLFLI